VIENDSSISAANVQRNSPRAFARARRFERASLLAAQYRRDVKTAGPHTFFTKHTPVAKEFVERWC
jgi:hypothetical protein